MFHSFFRITHVSSNITGSNIPLFAISTLSLSSYRSSSWWQKHSSVAGVKLALVEYLCGLCIAQFRRDVRGFLLERKKVSGEHKIHLMTADVPLCYHTLKLYLVDREPWFGTGNKADVKTISALAAHLFDKEPYAVHPERAKGFKDRHMEKEMFEWTRRFNVRLLGLPPELRKIIPPASSGDVANPPAVVRIQNGRSYRDGCLRPSRWRSLAVKKDCTPANLANRSRAEDK